jgi:hypothetical protein
MPVVYLSNASELPVYDVVVEVGMDGGTYGRVNMSVLPPSGSPVERLSDNAASLTLPPVAMWFRDSTGVHWQRDRDGTPISIDQPHN